MTDQSAPQTFPPTVIDFPNAFQVRTAAAHLDHDGLWLTLVTDGNWGGTFLFTDDNIEALRESLAAPKMIPADWWDRTTGVTEMLAAKAADPGPEVFVLTPEMVPPAWDAIAAARVESEPMVIS